MTMEARRTPALIEAVGTEGGAVLILSEQVRLALRHYFAQLNGHEPHGLYALVIGEVEKPLIETVLEQCRHNQSKAAQMLGLSRSTLRKKMTQHGIP
ncbi:helix-turn-helix domain-containing protein [Candidatus Methylocalor cossyra]|uniref:Putative Fis-like DNA-binding protein n=1 Tax=Candidatus Methylocalor cossyra TaxID=3108543 RepID=A0ABM9NF03_9GAMM